MSKYYQISSFVEGEGIRIVTPLTEEQLIKIQQISGHDFMDDLTLEHSVGISEVTLGQTVEGELNGATFDGCYDKDEQIRYLLDHDLEQIKYDYLKEKYPEELKEAEKYKDLEELQNK